MARGRSLMSLSDDKRKRIKEIHGNIYRQFVQPEAVLKEIISIHGITFRLLLVLILEESICKDFQQIFIKRNISKVQDFFHSVFLHIALLPCA